MKIRIFPSISIGIIIAIYYQNINMGLQIALIFEIILDSYYELNIWYRGNRPANKGSFLQSIVILNGGNSLPRDNSKVTQEMTARIIIIALSLVLFNFVAVLLILTFIHEDKNE